VYASAHKPTKRSVAFACARHLACALPRAHSLHTTTLFVRRCRPDPPTHPLSFSCACTRPEESFAQLGNNVVPRPLPALAHAGPLLRLDRCASAGGPPSRVRLVAASMVVAH
jgi:hypothetical protein